MSRFCNNFRGIRGVILKGKIRWNRERWATRQAAWVSGRGPANTPRGGEFADEPGPPEAKPEETDGAR